MKTRRKFTSAFKTKVVLEAISERLTISEIAEKHKVHPNQIGTWKKQFLNNAETIFETGTHRKPKDSEQEANGLYKKIGQLQIEVDFLKKALES
ncbi:MAG: transposase [Chlorobi bacterium]|nr:transposase [Chlorobiota bacterium]